MIIVAGVVAVIVAGLIAVLWRESDPSGPRQPSAPKPPRQPADISPFTAGLIGLDAGRGNSYKPIGVTAVTPAGTLVHVSCPHLTGHRSPELAVKCGEAEKSRIETYGR